MRCTLITPLRNERPGVERLWRSIKTQSRMPDEWIIMDNGSTDGTDRWLEERASTAPFTVRVLRMPDVTIARMMNEAIRAASGEIIASCHGGTRIPEDWLSQLLQPMERDFALDVSAGVWVPEGETPFERWLAGTMGVHPNHFSERDYLPATRSIAFKKSAWEKVGGFPEWLPRFGEDTLFAIRMRAAGLKFAIAREAVVGWRPKGSWRSFFRQEQLYTEAETLMELFPMTWRYWIRPWSLLPLFVSLVALVKWPIALSLTLLLPLVDAWRLRTKGAFRFGSFKSYLFWMWLLPLAYQSGYLNARYRLRPQLETPPPQSDLDAVAWYKTQRG